MNFFAAQDRAKRASRRLIAVYVVATAIIVAGVTLVVGIALYAGSDAVYQPAVFLDRQGPVLVVTAVVTTLFIVGATLYRMSTLAAGGGRVAAELGGTQITADVNDPLRRRLRNVVEEMAIASGVPVPEIYVLEEEGGINAFAAGYAPGDAAVAVTRGALEVLERDELQGVVAHEFSHILNGDMRLNIRMMGVLFGIMALGLMGRLILRGGGRGRMLAGRRNKGAGAILLIGAGLAIFGAIGVFFARILKAAVSRQREYLADAAAVQFTRQTRGIANALKKIGGYAQGSLIQASDAEEVSHMLFGTGLKLSRLFATHPPLTARIQALEPGFSDRDYPRLDPRVDLHLDRRLDSRIDGRIDSRVDRRLDDSRPDRRLDPRSAERAPPAAGGARQPAAVMAFTAAAEVPSPGEICASAGRPGSEHVAYARQIHASIPAPLYDAAHSIDLAWMLVLALLLDRSGRVTNRQLTLLDEQLGGERRRVVASYYDALAPVGAEYRLPLLEIAFPALKKRPAGQIDYLLTLARRLIDLDGELDLYEYCFQRILAQGLMRPPVPGTSAGRRKPGRRAVREAAVRLLGVLAKHGHDSEERRAEAFRAGLEGFGRWVEDVEYEAGEDRSLATLDRSLDVLMALNGAGRERLVTALAATAAFDGRLAVAEAELLRAVCATLDCPLPPIVTAIVTTQSAVRGIDGPVDGPVDGR